VFVVAAAPPGWADDMLTTPRAIARDDGRLMLVGDTAIEGAMPDWLGRSPFAVYEKRAG